MKDRKKKQLLGILYKAHRYIGLATAGIIIAVAVTGVMINHTDQLRLAHRFVDSESILDWYGIQASDHPLAFRTAHHWISSSFSITELCR